MRARRAERGGGRAPRRHEVPPGRGRGIRGALRLAGRRREPGPGGGREEGADFGRGRLGADRPPPVEQGAARRPAFQPDPERGQREARSTPSTASRASSARRCPSSSRSTRATTRRSPGSSPPSAAAPARRRARPKKPPRRGPDDRRAALPGSRRRAPNVLRICATSAIASRPSPARASPSSRWE